MSPQELNDLADEFFRSIKEDAATAEAEEQSAIDLERQLAVRNCLEQSFWALDSIRKNISTAADIETSKKRFKLLLRIMSAIDEVQTQIEDLM